MVRPPALPTPTLHPPLQHYIPTLLASKQLEQETECGAFGVSATDWSAGGAHPKSYT